MSNVEQYETGFVTFESVSVNHNVQELVEPLRVLNMLECEEVVIPLLRANMEIIHQLGF